MDMHLVELALPLATRFSTAHGAIDERRVVLVGLGDGEATGWGEAAPYPGVTPDTVEGVWACLTDETLALTPSARAAVEEAQADLAARLTGRPLWAVIGGFRRPMLASVVVSLDEDVDEKIDSSGASAVKLKIRPGDDLARVEQARRSYPGVTIGVDANGSYTWDDREPLLAMDRYDVAYVEQPFAEGDLEQHARLRQELVADVVLDEPIESVEAALRVVEGDAADVLTVKPGRIGLEACRTIHDLALVAGLRVAASGLLETAVGRAHTLAIAALPGTAHCDLADDRWFFGAATGAPATKLVDGWITPSEGPGIGVDPDFDALASYVVREQRGVTPPGVRDRGR
jgi:o-succinylbenzoate synthase